MKLEYSTFKDNDLFTLTNFSCHSSMDLLNKKGLYKIIWYQGQTTKIKVDGYQVALKKDQVLFCTPLNVIEMDLAIDGITSFVFNKEFFCIQTHDDQVSCNGLLFFGSSQPQIVSLQEKDIRSKIMQTYYSNLPKRFPTFLKNMGKNPL